MDELENSVRTGQFAVKPNSTEDVLKMWGDCTTLLVLDGILRQFLTPERIQSPAPEGRASLAQRFSAGKVEERIQVPEGRPSPRAQSFRGWASTIDFFRYPLTLILENDSTAVPAVGRPMESAGWKVVKISRFFNCGSTAWASSGCDRMR
jgi:hypothetical protein